MQTGEIGVGVVAGARAHDQHAAVEAPVAQLLVGGDRVDAAVDELGEQRCADAARPFASGHGGGALGGHDRGDVLEQTDVQGCARQRTRHQEARPGRRQGECDRVTAAQPDHGRPGRRVDRAQLLEHLPAHGGVVTGAGHEVRAGIGHREEGADLPRQRGEQGRQLGVRREQAHLLVQPLGAGQPLPLLLLVRTCDRARQRDERDLVTGHQHRQPERIGRRQRLGLPGEGHACPRPPPRRPGPRTRSASGTRPARPRPPARPGRWSAGGRRPRASPRARGARRRAPSRSAGRGRRRRRPPAYRVPAAPPVPRR